MKKIFFFLLTVVLINFKTIAQTGDTSLHASAIAVCDCLSKAKIENNSTPQQLQQIFLQCILTSAPDLVTKMMGNGQDNMQAAEETATNLALEMMKTGCPAFTKIATAMMGSAGGDTVEMEVPMAMPSTSNAEAQSTDGTVVKVEERDFTYITVKTTAGRELTFMYYKYVPGSDDWIKDAVNKLKNKNVSLSYVETEVYQPKFKQFMNVREIKTLTVK
ncbi:MAG: hypothetical protein JO072_03210 [Parafilimonas sp.]|nr:hypothetical protein [Parafilimonas sp.]